MAKTAWIQTSLFSAQAQKPRRTGENDQARRRLSYTRVTRDPLAALSYAESRLVAAQVTRGLAAAFGQLSPERRAQLRAAIGCRPTGPRSA